MSDWMVTQGPIPRRRPRALSPLREHLRDTFWFAPTAAMVGVFVVWLAAQELDAALVRSLQDDGDYDTLAELLRFADDAKTVVSAVGSAMMTFIGVVFSISLVAVQMASGQFTPRVVRLFVRSRITKATFAVFLATFVLTLLVLTSYDSNADPRTAVSVPLVQSVLTLVMVALSLLLFVMYVNATLRLMRVSHVIARIAAESFRVAALMPVPADGGEVPGLGPATAWVAHDGQAGVLRDVHVARLVRVARKHGVVLRLVPRIGDFLVPGTPVLAVHGGAAPSRRALRYALSVGVERTFHQDLAFGLRQLSDIGLRALSPAVNDPTTAVQALDRVVQILATLSRRPLDAVPHRDRRGTVRLVQPVPGWTELVDLGFAEVRACAVGSPQVTRRLLAGLDDLLLLVPPERRGPLLRHRELLRQAVERTAPTPADRAFALRPDRQGIG
ncbi:DUF2254 domain-containing protein [Streptomyces sp. PU10]|uniref:DUF2254 domain-containing protein n=1 Tax=Streptomyces TaxID=1883 RepID=UPI002852941B|nr:MULTISPECIES: DUF2254 domain-containing protein [Streptomyces]MDU0257403.1 DUF2254 domain-containing protein [Streptomyces sp. PU10]